MYILRYITYKGKGHPATGRGVPGRLRPRIFLTFGTTRVVGRQPYAPAAFTPGEIPGTHIHRLSRPQGTWFRREPRKKSPVTPPGIDPRTSRPVEQCVYIYIYMYMYVCIWYLLCLNVAVILSVTFPRM